MLGFCNRIHLTSCI